MTGKRESGGARMRPRSRQSEMGFQGTDTPEGVLPPEVRNQDFAVALVGTLLGGVGELHALDMEAVEQGADLGNVVQRQDELAAQALEAFRELREIFLLEVVVVQLAAKVRRIEIEQGCWAVVAAKNLLVRQALDLHPFQPLVGIFKERGEFGGIESRRLYHMPVVGGMTHEARKGIFEKVEIPRRPLHVGQGRWIGCLQQFEPAAAHEKEFAIPDEFLVVRLADAEEVHNLAVEIIQHLHPRGLLVEEHLGAAREGLDVRRVLRKYLNDPLCETVFPSDV